MVLHLYHYYYLGVTPTIAIGAKIIIDLGLRQVFYLYNVQCLRNGYSKVCDITTRMQLQTKFITYERPTNAEIN